MHTRFLFGLVQELVDRVFDILSPPMGAILTDEYICTMTVYMYVYEYEGNIMFQFLLHYHRR